MNKLITFFVFLTLSTLVNAGTGFLTGQKISGINKICYFKGPSGAFSKTVSSSQVCPTSADDGRGVKTNNSYSAGSSTNNTGFYSSERINGLNKICYYNSPRGTFTKTIGSAQVCPRSIRQ
jgi:hypothetical protein